MRTRIKFCGLVRADDVSQAVALGVDSLGFVFYERSPRFLSEPEAKALRGCVPSWIRVVGLFVNAPDGQVRKMQRSIGLDVIQFHGDESPAQCDAAAGETPYWRAVRMRSKADLLESAALFPRAEALLLDTFSAGYGGSGQRFDWSWVDRSDTARYVMSGGLDAGNVAEAIGRVQPWGVDVSSGIQSDDPRRKDPSRMKAFVAAVLRADAERASPGGFAESQSPPARLTS